ncbi:PfkB family carbohydrate kinase [Actinomyces sp. B33]|uniref:PfkB family carbohydrate kinase n=1 Tax=Actinomyces sp. B33 TaxID=2942131 RepID=UPI00233FBEDE|nr:PfkB family carbohydrate kinase [Actinomyces sp. B33]MDC4233489.1 PfkB family carbohydrate kinase [Actinomyces sp. B33]
MIPSPPASTTPSRESLDRARGALVGLALGDALGMPTQAMSPEQIDTDYGRITGLTAASPNQPYAPGMPAGSVTDDTEQALLIADLLIDGDGRIDPMDLASALLAWEDDMIRRGSLDLLGPSTKSALERVRAGADPTTTGTTGATNGAAMRVCPVGIATPADDPDLLFARVWESCRVTHATRQGFQAAGLVASAVSLGVDGAEVDEALSGAVALVSSRDDEGAWNEHADVLARTRMALDLARDDEERGDEAAARERFLERVRALIGTSVDACESIPAAFALARRYASSPVDALLGAANLGGDTDTIGAIAGAVLGSCLGPGAFAALDASTPAGADGGAIGLVESVNGLDLSERAASLLALRRRSAPGPSHGSPSPPVVGAPIPSPAPAPPADGDAARGGGGRVVLLGQVIVDLALRLDRLPDPGGDVFAEDAGMHAGGGYNALVAARRMGAPAVSLSAVGDGGFASIITRALADAGVEDAGPRVDGVDSGYCVALTDDQGERTFVSTRGAETRVPADAWADYSRERLRPGDVVHIDGYALAHPSNIEALRRFAAAGAPPGVRVVVDVSPVVGDVPLDALLALGALDPLWSMNEREAGILVERLLLSGAAPGTGPADAARALADRLCGPVVVRAGASGAWYAEPASPLVHIPTPRVDAVDTNGSGDAHSGALAACLVERTPLDRALLLANCAGALAATRIGPATCPDRAAVEEAADRLAG